MPPNMSSLSSLLRATLPFRPASTTLTAATPKATTTSSSPSTTRPSLRNLSTTRPLSGPKKPNELFPRHILYPDLARTEASASTETEEAAQQQQQPNPLSRKKQANTKTPRPTYPIPPYPHGTPTTYKQSSRGLYARSTIQFGNNVSSRNEIKTRRNWRPNLQSKTLFSVALNERIKVRLTMRVLRTIDKCGGLDEYLLGERPARIKDLGELGWRLRWRVMQSAKVRTRLGNEAVALGVDDGRRIGRGWVLPGDLKVDEGLVPAEVAVPEEEEVKR